MQDAEYLPGRAGAQTKYRGVYLHRASGLWHARVTIARHTYSLAYHHSAEAAAEAVRAFRSTHGLAIDVPTPAVPDDCFVIPLRARTGYIRAHALIDRADAALAALQWSLTAGGYVRSSCRLLLHRAVVGLETSDPREPDHIDRDPLNNRRSNLRILSHAEQMQNVPSWGATSQQRGVSFDKAHGKWKATASVAGKRHHLGFHDDEQEAARAAQDFRREHMPYATD